MKPFTLTRLSITLPKDVARALKNAAQGNQVSVSVLVEVALVAYLLERSADKIRDALARHGASLRRTRAGRLGCGDSGNTSS